MVVGGRGGRFDWGNLRNLRLWHNLAMQNKTNRALVDLNYKFYQQFAADFDATRQRLQPGVLQLLTQIPANSSILDLGCGNGEVWRSLRKRGFTGRYTGLDFSAKLLESAAQREPDKRAVWVRRDLSKPGWTCQDYVLLCSRLRFFITCPPRS